MTRKNGKHLKRVYRKTVQELHEEIASPDFSAVMFCETKTPVVLPQTSALLQLQIQSLQSTLYTEEKDLYSCSHISLNTLLLEV